MTSVNASVLTFLFSFNVTATTVVYTFSTLSGDSATVSPLINGSPTVPATATCTAGAWTLTLTTALSTSGSRTLSATQTDTAGNTGTATNQTLKIDKTDPVVSVTSVKGSVRTIPDSTNGHATKNGGECGPRGWSRRGSRGSSTV